MKHLLIFVINLLQVFLLVSFDVLFFFLIIASPAKFSVSVRFYLCVSARPLLSCQQVSPVYNTWCVFCCYVVNVPFCSFLYRNTCCCGSQSFFLSFFFKSSSTSKTLDLLLKISDEFFSFFKKKEIYVSIVPILLNISGLYFPFHHKYIVVAIFIVLLNMYIYIWKNC